MFNFLNFFTLFQRKFFMPEGTIVQGNITSEIKGIIAGLVTGDVNITADVVIKETGTVNGSVKGKNVVIRGKIKGDVRSEGKVYALKNAEVHGNIFAGESIIDKESVVKGKISQLHTNTSGATTVTSDKPSTEYTPAPRAEKTSQPDDAAQSWF